MKNVSSKTALKMLAEFKLEWPINKTRFPKFYKEGYREGDEKCPLFCETTLYLLFGKEDGRTILGLIHNLARSAGVEDDELDEIL